jgi:hypothetical protein
MNATETLEYHRRYKQQHKQKYRDYARTYYATHKEQFKKYYETYKTKKQNKASGVIIEPDTTKLTNHQKVMLRYNKKLERLDAKKNAFIEKLKSQGWYDKKQNLLPPN